MHFAAIAGVNEVAMKHYVRSGLTALSIAALVAGCSSSSDHHANASSSNSSANKASTATTNTAAVGVPANLASFYNQKLDWTSCAQGQCAWLTVPLDYAKPQGATIKIAVNKMAAKGASKGSLVVNPGGPGGSGVDYAAAADQIVSPSVRSTYDIVGFDPRGVQRSAAITCVDDGTLDAEIGSDPAPETKADDASFMRSAESFGQACKKNAGPLLEHVSTLDVAKDVDILRAALGEKKLNYLGKSYGTSIGAVYADTFPKNVGRMVLDGVLPPDLTMEQMNEGQAKGFERALDAYLKDCTGQSGCPLGNDPASAKKALQNLLDRIEKSPLPVTGATGINKLTEGWAVYGIADTLYNKRSWPTLTPALASAIKGDGTQLLSLGEDYAQRNPDGTYQGNMMQVINAVSCLDRPAPADGATTYEKDAVTFSKEAPTWGKQLAWGGAVCNNWPGAPTAQPKPVHATGSAPIMVIGTTRDPATPYEWAKHLADELSNARFVSYDGDGHTAYGEGSSCVDGIVDKYLVQGDVPSGSSSC